MKIAVHAWMPACTSSFTNSSGYRPVVCEAQTCKLTNYSSTCASDGDCASGVCDTQGGQCVPTRGDNMCPSGMHEVQVGDNEFECVEPSTAACLGFG